MEMSVNLREAIGLYCIAVAILFVVRPEPVFDASTSAPRAFGTHSGQTLFSLQTVMTVMAVLCYYYVAIGP